jgi:hypothetical protein
MSGVIFSGSFSSGILKFVRGSDFGSKAMLPVEKDNRTLGLIEVAAGLDGGETGTGATL